MHDIRVHLSDYASRGDYAWPLSGLSLGFTVQSRRGYQ
jgi:hypothetical protein